MLDKLRQDVNVVSGLPPLQQRQSSSIASRSCLISPRFALGVSKRSRGGKNVTPRRKIERTFDHVLSDLCSTLGVRIGPMGHGPTFAP